MNSDDVRLLAERERREFSRWLILQTCDVARPQNATLRMLVGVLQAVYPDVTEMEVRRQLDYLEERDLVKLHTDPLGQVRAELRRAGVDIVEYTVDVEPGILRPPKK